jgi:hypothetical protein
MQRAVIEEMPQMSPGRESAGDDLPMRALVCAAGGTDKGEGPVTGRPRVFCVAFCGECGVGGTPRSAVLLHVCDREARGKNRDRFWLVLRLHGCG